MKCLSAKVLKVSIFFEDDVGNGCFIEAESIANISASEAVADSGEQVGIVLKHSGDSKKA